MIIDVDLKLVQENSVHPVPIVTDVAKMPVCAAIRHTGGTNSARLRRMYASAGADVTITGEFKESRPTMLPNPVRLSGICILLALPLLACGRQPEAGVSAVTVTETAVTSLSDTESAAPEEHTDPDSSAADSTEAGSGAMAAAAIAEEQHEDSRQREENTLWNPRKNYIRNEQILIPNVSRTTRPKSYPRVRLRIWASRLCGASAEIS